MALNTILSVSFLCFLLPGHYLWNEWGLERKWWGVLGEIAKKFFLKVLNK